MWKQRKTRNDTTKKCKGPENEKGAIARPRARLWMSRPQQRLHYGILANLAGVGATIVQPPEDIDDVRFRKAHVDETAGGTA